MIVKPLTWDLGDDLDVDAECGAVFDDSFGASRYRPRPWSGWGRSWCVLEQAGAGGVVAGGGDDDGEQQARMSVMMPVYGR
jgi:hypothetical protein